MTSAKVLIVLAVLVGGACTSTPSKPAGGVVETSSTTVTSVSDPYDVYLKNNPEPGHVISREDAQTRALLGCGQPWAPGTVDAVLHEAYKQLCR